MMAPPAACLRRMQGGKEILARAPIGVLTGEAAVVYTNAAYKLLP